MSRVDPEWAEMHGYYHYTCHTCGLSGWTDTVPDCDCNYVEKDEEEEDVE